MRARLLLTVLLAVPSAFAYACGGADNTLDAGDGSSNDVTVNKDTGGSDTGTSNDTGTNDTGTNDTGTSDTGTDAGATDGGSKDSGAVDSSLKCQKPSDCTNEFCCGTIVFNGGQPPNCNLQSVSSACATTCKSNIALSCTATDTIRSCAASADCADAGTNYTKCCTVPFGDASAEFCWNPTYAGAVGGSCQP